MASGEYSSTDEVLHEALQALDDRDRLRTLIRQGIEELERGERIPAEEVFIDLHNRAKATHSQNE